MEPPTAAEDTEAQAAVRAVYTDPVTIYGLPLDLGQLVRLVRAAGATYADVERQILDVAEGDSKLAVALVLRGHHVGPLRTVLGTVSPSGRWIEMRVIDILTLVDGRISNVRMTADELGVLAGIDAITIVA